MSWNGPFENNLRCSGHESKMYWTRKSYVANHSLRRTERENCT